MRKWIIILWSVLLLQGFFAQSALADNSNVQTATQWCSGLISTTAIISPLVECFTDTTQGIIPTVTSSFLGHMQKDYMPLVTVIFLLVIAYHGIRMFLGDIQRIKADTIVLGLKMAGVVLFMTNAPAIYLNMVGILQNLSQDISSAATSLHTTGFCIGSTTATTGTDNSQWQWGGSGLWGRWDCIFQYLLGFSATGFAAASIASFLLLVAYSMGTGILVLFMALGLIYSLLNAAFRFIHVYLMAVLALSFMFCLGFMFVPLLLFRNTFEYFRKWLSMVFGFILTPVIMFAFMGMMLMAADITLFSGQFSVFCEIGGSSYCGSNAQAGSTLFSNMTGNINPNNNSSNIAAYNKEMFQMGLNGPQSVMDTSLMGSGEAALGTGTGTGCSSADQGATGENCVMNMTADQFVSENHPAAAKMAVPETQLKMETLASNAGSSCTTTDVGSGGTFGINGSGSDTQYYYSNCPWLANILISLCVAALVIYIMLSLLTYIPTLASNLSSQIIQGDLASSGKDMIQSGIKNVQDAASKASSGGPDGGLLGNTRNVLNAMVGKR